MIAMCLIHEDDDGAKCLVCLTICYLHSLTRIILFSLHVKQRHIDEMKRKAYCVAKEIVESEETFVGVLKLLNTVCWLR